MKGEQSVGVFFLFPSILFRMTKTLKVITGPTGVGKTAYAMAEALRLDCPIINADSRQLYRDIPIGTAAPTTEEQARVKHYFVGILDLDTYYSAAEYEVDALALLNKLFLTHDTLILTGGSMMYIDAVCKGIDPMPTVDDDVREALRVRYEQEGLSPLLSELKLLDPTYYARCDLRNYRRIIHALEVCYMTGQPYSSFLTGSSASRPFRIEKMALTRPREILYERINRRVDEMMALGLLEEVQSVIPYRYCNALDTVGYKELFAYLDGKWPLDFALEKIRRNTRVYAKKQLTWLKRDPEVQWVSLEDECNSIRL